MGNQKSAAMRAQGAPKRRQEHPRAARSSALVLAKRTIPENQLFVRFEDHGELLFYEHGRPEIGENGTTRFGPHGKTVKKHRF